MRRGAIVDLFFNRPTVNALVDANPHKYCVQQHRGKRLINFFRAIVRMISEPLISVIKVIKTCINNAIRIY